jgi:hypothetical protein
MPILRSLPFAGPFLTSLHILLNLAIIIATAIARMAPSTTWCCGIRPILIIIMLVDYLIAI